VNNISIITDYNDYYDYLADKTADIKYIRLNSDSPGRGKDLTFLKSIGISTVKLNSVRDIASKSGKIVVYTDVKKHGGQGKLLMSLDEASLVYANALASEYHEESAMITYKFLQIGKRRFRCILKNKSHLEEGDVTDLQELDEGYNYCIGLPIFSIDYVSTDSGMLAVDFNRVQNIEKLGLAGFMTSYDVIEEIYASLLKYNKI
jgi:hypothetical protein